MPGTWCRPARPWSTGCCRCRSPVNPVAAAPASTVRPGFRRPPRSRPLRSRRPRCRRSRWRHDGRSHGTAGHGPGGRDPRPGSVVRVDRVGPPPRRPQAAGGRRQRRPGAAPWPRGRPGGRVRLRQDDSGSGHRRSAAADRRVDPGRRDDDAGQAHPRRPAPGADGLPGPDVVAEPEDAAGEHARRTADRARHGAPAAGRVAGPRTADVGRAARAGARSLPRHALRWATAARRDRPGAGAGAGDPGRRRDHLGAGRVHPGAGAHPAAGSQGPTGADGVVHQPQPGGDPAGLRPGRRDVPGTHRGTGPDRDDLHPARASLHPAAALVDPTAGRGEPGRRDRGRDRPAGVHRDTGRLPVPPTVRAGSAAVAPPRIRRCSSAPRTTPPPAISPFGRGVDDLDLAPTRSADDEGGIDEGRGIDEGTV